MPIAATDLILYGSANRPEDDTSTVGGAIDTTDRATFTDLTANSVIAVVSDGADTRTITITGRNAAGEFVSEGIVLNGVTEVVGTTTFERILKIVASATDASRTVTVRQGAGGATKATIPVDEIGAFAMFIKSASESGATTRFEKMFWRNSHATLTLNSATVAMTADPSVKMRIGLATAKDDSATATNRKTAPGGITFVDGTAAQAVPTNELAATEAIGVWIEEALTGSDIPYKSTFTTECAGTSV